MGQRLPHREPVAVAPIEALARLTAEHRLDAIYVFGSRAAEIAARAAGEAVTAPTSPESDVDIGVLPERGHNLSARERVRIALAIEDLFDVGRVDLVVLPEASAFLASDIVAGELLVARDPGAEAEYQLYVLRRAGDLAPFARERTREWLQGEAIWP